MPVLVRTSPAVDGAERPSSSAATSRGNFSETLDRGIARPKGDPAALGTYGASVDRHGPPCASGPSSDAGHQLSRGIDKLQRNRHASGETPGTSGRTGSLSTGCRTVG